MVNVIDPAQSTLGAAGSPPTTSQSDVDSAFSTLGEDQELFLQLLVTQLESQNPLDPMETETFVDQITQFSQLEQQVMTNDELVSLRGDVQAANSRIEPSFIGKNVEAITPVIGLTGGTAEFDLILDRASASTSLTIFDVNGQVVSNLSGPTNSGRTTLTWDGTDNNGNTLPDGPYFVEPQAVDAEGATIPAQTIVTAPVKEVRFGLEGESTFVLEHDAIISEDELVAVKQ